MQGADTLWNLGEGAFSPSYLNGVERTHRGCSWDVSRDAPSSGSASRRESLRFRRRGLGRRMGLQGSVGFLGAQSSGRALWGSAEVQAYLKCSLRLKRFETRIFHRAARCLSAHLRAHRPPRASRSLTRALAYRAPREPWRAYAPHSGNYD